MRNRRPKSFVRGTALLLSLLLAVPLQASAVTIDEVQTRQEELAQENAQLEEKLATLKEDESAALEYQATLEEKIGVVEEKIDTARENIQLMDEEILVLEKKLDAAQEEYQETLDLFAQRVRALYKTGNADTLAVLLNSKSFSEFALKTEMMSAVARHDQEIVDQLTEYVDATQADREELQKLQEEVAQNKRDLESDQDELKDLNAENEAVIADLVDQQLMVEDTIQQNESEDAELNATLEALLAAEQARIEEERRQQELAAQQAAQEAQQAQEEQNAQETTGEEGSAEGTDTGDTTVDDGSGDTTTGDTTDDTTSVVIPETPVYDDSFNPIWPCPGYAYISGHFGDIYDDGNPHNGLDIAAAYGTPIIAAQSGTVLYADYHWSWGNNVLISHNANYATRYAHCSSLAVSVGQYVEQGQIIGYVGSTGYSFGNHLHFEVYYNNVRVDPDPYLGI